MWGLFWDVELHTSLQAIATVKDNVWVRGTEAGQTRGQQFILALRGVGGEKRECQQWDVSSVWRKLGGKCR